MRSRHDIVRGYWWGCIALLLIAALAAPVSVAQDRTPGARPQSGDVATQPISIHFEDVPLLTVIESIGAQTGKNFDVDASVSSQRVTIISHKPVAPELAYSILESILSSRNYVMVETVDGNLIKVVPRDRERDKLTVNTGRDTPLVGYDAVVIQVVPVKFSNAEDVAAILAATGSEDNHIDVYTQTNTLVIRDTADGIRNMFKLLDVIDVPGQNVSLEIFTLRFTRAEALIEQISEVLLDESASGPQRPPIPTPAQRARAARPGGGPVTQAPNVVGQRERILRMVPDERLNALIVVASGALMDQVRHLVARLDTPTPFDSNNMHYVELQNADAEEVETALTAITSVPPREANAGAAGGEVQPFEKSVTIARYEQTNALLIVASPQDFELLKTIIDQLDQPRRQVNVEAIIMEVTINDRFELGVEGLGLANNDYFALSNVVSLANAIALGPLSLAGPGATIGVIDGTTTVFNPLTNASQTVQNIPFLLRALESITDLEVLSQPNLLTVDNEEAEINVGQEIPVISSLSNVNNNTSFVDRGAINREDVGVKLKVTPQIGESDFVFMAIEVEVSSAVESNVSIDVNELGPTLQKSNITSNVVVGHGQTGVIGGLIRETRERAVSQVPLLGDLPLIGWLGRNKSSGRAKQNLVVLVTPHVIRRGEDLTAVTDFRTNEFYAENLDVIFQKGGFVKKIRRKHHKREKYHPTQRYAADENGARNFGRGIPSETAPDHTTEVSSEPEAMEVEPEISEIEPMEEIEPSSQSTNSDPVLTIAESTPIPAPDEEEIVIILPEPDPVFVLPESTPLPALDKEEIVMVLPEEIEIAVVVPEETQVKGWFDLDGEAVPNVAGSDEGLPEEEPEFSVQIGAFVNPEHAAATKTRVETDSVYTAEVSRSSGSDYSRVLLGRFSDRAAAEAVRDVLRMTPDFRDCFVTERDTKDVASVTLENDTSRIETAELGTA